MTGLALLLKPLGFAAVAVFWYFVVIRGLRWLYPRLPRNWLVDFLFRERSDRKPDFGPGYSPTANGVAPRAAKPE